MKLSWAAGKKPGRTSAVCRVWWAGAAGDEGTPRAGLSSGRPLWDKLRLWDFAGRGICPKRATTLRAVTSLALFLQAEATGKAAGESRAGGPRAYKRGCCGSRGFSLRSSAVRLGRSPVGSCQRAPTRDVRWAGRAGSEHVSEGTKATRR